jgi:aminoglycoside phosphotransferase (APT) family kinase protein
MSNNEYINRLLDPDSLQSYLTETLGSADTFDFQRHQAGHSNGTLFIEWGEHDLVLRRPPPGETADTAHDITREFRVMSALQGTDVAVPPMVLECQDRSVIGSEFYLMERVEGEVIRLEEPNRLATPEHRAALGRTLVDSLATIHSLDCESIGLDDFGRPEEYLQRQVDRWQQQLEWAASRTNRPKGLPGREAVEAWLEDACPDATAHTLIHGDFKLDNLIIAPGTTPDINAIVDWELSTLGAPLADLSWMLLFWHDDPNNAPPIPKLMPAFTAREGYPTRRELAERYESQTDLTLENFAFYRVLAAYKLADDSDDPLYAAMDSGTPTLMAHTREIISGDRAW